MPSLPPGNGNWQFTEDHMRDAYRVVFDMSRQEIAMHGANVLKMAMEHVVHQIAEVVLKELGQDGIEEILEILEDRRAAAVDALADACSDRQRIRCHRCEALLQRGQWTPWTWTP